MSTPVFEVIKPGIYTTFQDHGRIGYQQYGVPVSGAMDQQARRAANHILGNHKNSPVLEITLTGTKLKVIEDHIITITGGDLDAYLDGQPVDLWRSVEIKRGQTLRFRGPKQGLRAYLAVQSGFDAPTYLGSASVYEKGNLGEPVRKQQVLYAHNKKENLPKRLLKPDERPQYSKQITVHYVPSDHQDRFTTDSLTTFHNQTWTVRRGDRMALLLEGGQPLKHINGADIISEPTVFGTIQVPANGNPMVLMADAQTTGGYTTLGVIVREDLSKLAQLPPGGKIEFIPIES